MIGVVKQVQDFSSGRGAKGRGNAAHFKGFGDEALAENPVLDWLLQS
jgi:hypothetical protein